MNIKSYTKFVIEGERDMLHFRCPQCGAIRTRIHNAIWPTIIQILLFLLFVAAIVATVLGKIPSWTIHIIWLTGLYGVYFFFFQSRNLPRSCLKCGHTWGGKDT